MFENAKWIRYKLPHLQYGYRLNLPMPYIRRSFQVKGEVKNMTLRICALGYGVCYLNGKPVTDDLLTTLVSAYDKTVYYCNGLQSQIRYYIVDCFFTSHFLPNLNLSYRRVFCSILQGQTSQNQKPGKR